MQVSDRHSARWVGPRSCSDLPRASRRPQRSDPNSKQRTVPNPCATARDRFELNLPPLRQAQAASVMQMSRTRPRRLGKRVGFASSNPTQSRAGRNLAQAAVLVTAQGEQPTRPRLVAIVPLRPLHTRAESCASQGRDRLVRLAAGLRGASTAGGGLGTSQMRRGALWSQSVPHTQRGYRSAHTEPT